MKILVIENAGISKEIFYIESDLFPYLKEYEIV